MKRKLTTQANKAVTLYKELLSAYKEHCGVRHKEHCGARDPGTKAVLISKIKTILDTVEVEKDISAKQIYALYITDGTGWAEQTTNSDEGFEILCESVNEALVSSNEDISSFINVDMAVLLGPEYESVSQDNISEALSDVEMDIQDLEDEVEAKSEETINEAGLDEDREKMKEEAEKREKKENSKSESFYEKNKGTIHTVAGVVIGTVVATAIGYYLLNDDTDIEL